MSAESFEIDLDVEIDIPSTHGWKPSPVDVRDFSYEQLMQNSQLRARATNLLSSEGSFGTPQRVDLRKKFFPIRNQGRIASCVGYSSASIQEYFNISDVKLTQYLSPQFIYNLREDPTSEGMYLRDACKILKNSGVCRDGLFPHGTGGSPGAPIRKDAQTFRITSYARITSLDGVKAALASGSPVLFGCACYNSQPNFWIRRDDEKPGGHCTTIVGFDDILEEFFFRNSWGTDWDEDGYGKISYSDFKNLEWCETWAFVDLDNTSPVTPIPEDNDKKTTGCCVVM